MASLMDAGVDGLITDYPDRLRTVMAQRGLQLPKPVRARPPCLPVTTSPQLTRGR